MVRSSTSGMSSTRARSHYLTKGGIHDLKVAFFGTHGAAKTTRAKAVTQVLRDLGNDAILIQETAAEAKEAGIVINEEGGFDSQKWILERQIELEVEAENNHEVIVCDRSVFDAIAYSMYLFRHGRMTRDELNRITTIALRHSIIYPYDWLYLCAPRQLQEDGIRSTNPNYQMEVAKIFEEIIQLYDLKVEYLD